MNTNHDKHIQKWWRWGSVLIVVFLIVTAYLLIYHKEHLLGLLQYIFWPLFIFFHFFMHRGHGKHGGGDDTHNHGTDKKEK